MREIKFRAWVVRDSDNGEEVVPYMEDMNGVESYFNPFEEHRKGNIVLMQYTGLKDKNGREIYEGDIIRWHERVTADYQITFTDGVFCLDGIGIQNLYHHREDLGKWEVVGNIYENPELLEV